MCSSDLRISVYFLLFYKETGNADWWFVKKHLTMEKGWVPSSYLMTENNYPDYVQKKIREKIDKLPVFDGKSSSSPLVKMKPFIHNNIRFQQNRRKGKESLPRDLYVL